MRDEECVRFLQWALPRIGHEWRGYRRVRRQVRRRLARRLAELGLPDLGAYRQLLEERPGEWARFERLCRVTISRFFRDRRLFETFAAEHLPRLERSARERAAERVRVWSAGCAAGEEPYSVAIAARGRAAGAGPRPPALEIHGTDVDPVLIARGAAAVYRRSSLREVPAELRGRAFERVGEDAWRLRPAWRAGVRLAVGDVRRDSPEGRFDAIFCRNLAFTYFGEEVRREVLARFAAALAPGGILIVGGHERLPAALEGAPAWRQLGRSVYGLGEPSDMVSTR